MSILGGSIIPCDYLTQDAGGKWIVVGTYSTVIAPGPENVLAWNLLLYLRLETEHAGTFAGSIVFAERARSPLDTTQPFELPVSLTILPAQVPTYEGRMILMGMQFKVDEDRQANTYKLPFSIQLRIGGAVVVSTPFTVVFPQLQSPPGDTP